MKRRLTSVFLLVLLCVAAILPLTACTATANNLVFGTDYSLSLKGKQAGKLTQEIEQRLFDLEKTLSVSIPTSELSILNAAEPNTPVAITDATKTLFLTALSYAEKSDGAFNAAIFPLVELWQFSPATFVGLDRAAPTQAEISALLPLADMGLFLYDETANTLTKTVRGAMLDFGGIAKGYAVDIAASVAKDTEYFIYIGGTIKTNRPSRIAVQHPRIKDAHAAYVHLENESIATSGDYHRFYMLPDGTRAHHILGRDGYPAKTNPTAPIVSATVVGESAMLCDLLSTVLVVDGLLAAHLVEELGYSALLINSDGAYATIGERFELVTVREG